MLYSIIQRGGETLLTFKSVVGGKNGPTEAAVFTVVVHSTELMVGTAGVLAEGLTGA